MLEICQVARASFQPIFAVKKERLIQCGVHRLYQSPNQPPGTNEEGKCAEDRTTLPNRQDVLDAGAELEETIDARPQSTTIPPNTSERVDDIYNHTNASVQDVQGILGAGEAGGTVEAEGRSALLDWMSGISANDMIPSLDLDVFPPLDDVFPSGDNMFPFPENMLPCQIDDMFSPLNDSFASGQ